MSFPALAEVRQRRAGGPRAQMFLRMLMRAATRGRGHAASALLAMVVAAAVATSIMNLSVDVESKLRKEFRNYGANVVVVAKEGQELPDGTLGQVQSVLGSHGMAVPFAYVVARASSGQAVVVSATNFEQVRQLESWWRVSAWPRNPGEVLVGERAASVVSPTAGPFDLRFQGRVVHCIPAGSLRTGAAEDSRVYLSLADFENWTGVEPSTIEIAVAGSPEEVSRMVDRLTQALPAAEVRPVRQVMEGEARVLGKTRATLLAATVLIILTSALCVLSTLMGWVIDHRQDFAIMKALGASQGLISGFFAAEAAALGVMGAVIGFAIGIGVAAWIGRVSFHAPVVPRFSVLPLVVLGSIVVALIAAGLPMSVLGRVQPAVILRGEE
ncbi:MAG TPA: FtsX-like permease family protein [Terriglobales bacterium]|nr:FtsX-like permease family protein [Terriglobales bacterium]